MILAESQILQTLLTVNVMLSNSCQLNETVCLGTIISMYTCKQDEDPTHTKIIKYTTADSKTAIGKVNEKNLQYAIINLTNMKQSRLNYL